MLSPPSLSVEPAKFWHHGALTPLGERSSAPRCIRGGGASKEGECPPLSQRPTRMSSTMIYPEGSLVSCAWTETPSGARTRTPSGARTRFWHHGALTPLGERSSAPRCIRGGGASKEGECPPLSQRPTRMSSTMIYPEGSLVSCAWTETPSGARTRTPSGARTRFWHHGALTPLGERSSAPRCIRGGGASKEGECPPLSQRPTRMSSTMIYPEGSLVSCAWTETPSGARTRTPSGARTRGGGAGREDEFPLPSQRPTRNT